MSDEVKKYLTDILESVLAIEEYLGEQRNFHSYNNTQQLRDAIERRLEIIGEAGKHVSEDTKSKFTTNEWVQIVGMRNVFVHEYFGIDNVIVWGIIKKDLPDLKKIIIAILEKIA